MAAFSDVIEYEPAELVMTVGAGMPLAKVQSLIAEHRQMLAFEPFDHGPIYGREIGAATIGGIIGAGVSGSRRVSAGAVRDHVLGFEAVSGRGERFVGGGRVVKNVTGYDLPKLMAGSWGQLVALTQVTLKVLPKPRESATVALHGLDDARAVRAMSLAMRSQAEVAAAAHVGGGLGRKGSEHRFVVGAEYSRALDARPLDAASIPVGGTTAGAVHSRGSESVGSHVGGSGVSAAHAGGTEAIGSHVGGLRASAAHAGGTEAVGTHVGGSGAGAASATSEFAAAGGGDRVGTVLGGDPLTCFRLEGFGPSVAARATMLRALLAEFGAAEVLSEEAATAFWNSVRDVTPLDDGRPLWRINVPASSAAVVTSALRDYDARWYYDWAGGLIWLTMPADSKGTVANAAVSDAAVTSAALIRHTAANAGGHAVLVRADASMRAAVPALHPEPPAVTALAGRIKAAFDPASVLDPHRFSISRDAN